MCVFRTWYARLVNFMYASHTTYTTYLTYRHGVMSLKFIGLCIANIFAEYNQQDAKFHNLFLQDALHISDGFSVHHQELKIAHPASGICQTITASLQASSR